MAGGVVGSMLTRKALNSGVSEFASPTTGPRTFGPHPLMAVPMKPQWIGIPTTWTALPSHISGWMRFVT